MGLANGHGEDEDEDEDEDMEEGSGSSHSVPAMTSRSKIRKDGRRLRTAKPHKTWASAHAGEGAQAAAGTRERHGQSRLVSLLF